MWYSVFLGRKESDGLLSEPFVDNWVKSPWLGANMDDDMAAFVGGGEPYPHREM